MLTPKTIQNIVQHAAPAAASGDGWTNALPFIEAVANCLECGLMLVGADDRVFFVSRPMAAILGLSVEQLRSMSAADLMRHLASCVEDPPSRLRDGQLIPSGAQICCEEFAIVRPERSIVRWIARAVNTPAPVRIIACEDITAVVELTARFETISSTDRLTGLANRRAGELALKREISIARRNGNALSVAMLDLDHFKLVNDRFGHAAGDEVLRGFGRLLSGTLRVSDVPIRWGGEEFLVLLPSTNLEAARVCVARIRSVLHARALCATVGATTMSAGLAQLEPSENGDAMVARADARLYEAKAAGRDCIRY